MKRIISCSDGTWNQPGEHDTNVYKIYRYISEEMKDGITGLTIKQVKNYDAGVGTTKSKAKNLFEGITGEGLDNNIKDAYRFVMQQYEEGDEIYLFGFSRGAYTARSVAGFIHNCGLLKNGHWEKLEEAFEYYRDRNKATKPSSAAMLAFKKAHCYTPRIKMLGVWDTVGSLGIPLNIFQRWNFKRYSFHDVRLSRSVENAYHALALHERRNTFTPTLWEKDEDVDIQQVLEQVWFSGVHSNVGGGYPDTGLSDTALKWMMCKAQHLGLHFTVNPKLLPDTSNAKLSDSALWYYRLTGLGWRDICKQIKSNEKIHRSVTSRPIEELPSNIRSTYIKYLAETEDELLYDN